MVATTVLHDDQEASLPDADWDGQGLWIDTAAPRELNGFELEPQGACYQPISGLD